MTFIGILFLSILSTSNEPCKRTSRDLSWLHAEERELAIRQSSIERMWWAAREVLENEFSIEARLKAGILIPFESGNGFKVSAKMKYKVGTPQLRAFMIELIREWRKELIKRDLDPLKHDLIITSLVRTHRQQQELIESGAPAADVSSHTREVALDIGKRWFEAHDPAYADALQASLEFFRDTERINLIAEDMAGVWHICLSPGYHYSLTKGRYGPTDEITPLP